MKRLLVGVFASIGVLVVLLLIVGVALSSLTRTQKRLIAEATILEVDLGRSISEQGTEDPLADLLLEHTATIRDIVEALQRAAGDPRVVALIARLGATSMGLAQIQEIRDAILAFRQAGKRAVAYAETFGEFQAANGAYYLATAFDNIYLQPSGDVGLTGMISEHPFLKDTLAKLGVVPRLDHRREYKNFMNMFTERQYTGPHREATQRVMESQFQQIVQGIAAGRRLSPEAVRALVDRGPFLGNEAVQAQLVDALAYRDEVYAQVKSHGGRTHHLLYLSQYLARAGRPHTSGDTVALIYGVGGVQLGRGGYDPVFGGPSMGSDTVSAAFRAAIEDTAVKAIIFRVDSPGGSYVASDTIWRETVRARDAGKPVIVTMGDVAGSGGYFVAMAADKIVAQPGTITGSIGVVGGKIVTKEFWDKLGLHWDEMHTSTNATMWSGTQDYTPEQWARLQTWLDRVYDDFTTRVATGRKLSKDQVLELAKGRIWTGEDAKQLGLVDALGGFPTALRLAREAIGVTAEAPLHLKLFPERRSTWERLLARVFGDDTEGSEPSPSARLLARTLEVVQPLARLARRLGLTPAPGVLMTPDL